MKASCGATASIALALSAMLASVSAQEPRRLSLAADSAFAAADIDRADSLYYMAVRLQPRDPAAREALGNYLGMRGASRIAAVLLEESRMFGADPVQVARRLEPLYESLGDWRAVLSLPSSPLSSAQRRQAAFLAEQPRTVRSDSTSVLLVGASHGDTLGRITVRIGGKPLLAVIVARDVGVIVGPRAVAASAIRFHGDSVFVVLDSINIGRSRLAMVPATIDPAIRGVIIGIAGFYPMPVTVDYGKKRLYLNQPRGSGRSTTLPLFRDHGDFRVAEAKPIRWSSLSAFIATEQGASESGAVTIDLKAGVIRIAY